MAKPLKRITPKLRQMAKSVVSGSGSNQEIASEMGISESRLSTLKSDPLFIALMDQYQRELDEKFLTYEDHVKRRAELAATELELMLQNPRVPANVRKDIGIEFMAQAGLRAGPKKQQESLSYEKRLMIRITAENEQKEKGRISDDTQELLELVRKEEGSA